MSNVDSEWKVRYSWEDCCGRNFTVKVANFLLSNRGEFPEKKWISRKGRPPDARFMKVSNFIDKWCQAAWRQFLMYPVSLNIQYIKSKTFYALKKITSFRLQNLVKLCAKQNKKARLGSHDTFTRLQFLYKILGIYNMDTPFMQTCIIYVERLKRSKKLCVSFGHLGRLSKYDVYTYRYISCLHLQNSLQSEGQQPCHVLGSLN